jgi:serine/threonine protein kinase/Tfp pilus assembly protein PilF
MIGKTISHYKILQEIGAGGMGVVYKAQDTKLDRLVALKFLPKQFSINEEEKQRFIHEAKAAAALDHPNICNIYEINETEEGQMFISMSYYAGETLKDKIKKGPIKLDEALDIVIQVAEGLNKAHKKDIVHRDIKSANILITDESLVKILDFGLAKLRGQTKLTKEGTTLGTVAYMSPEQTTGEEADHRSDIWSLGVLLYEMVTGQLPFKGDYEQAVVYSILNEDPEPVTAIRTGISTDIEKVIFKLLTKDTSKRYQHVDDLIVDLRKLKEDSKPEVSISRKKTTPVKMLNKSPKILILGTVFLCAIIIAAYYILTGPEASTEKEEIIATPDWENSIAVLPFRDFSPQKDQEYFCDGMTDAIIAKLSQLKKLKTISLTSVLQYKNQARNMKKIGAELAVKTILEGTIQKEGKHIRVNAQLIRVKDDSHLWQNTYNRELSSVFAIQDDISQAIVNALRIELIQNERELVSKNPTENTEAYNLYLQGRFFWRKRTIDGLRKSIDFYNHALEIDQNYSLAYSGLADTYTNLTYSKNIKSEVGYAKSKAAALKAIELNEKSAEARTSLGKILMEFDWEFQKARQELEHAIQLNPGYADAYLSYYRYYFRKGNLEKGLKVIRLAHELDPLSPSVMYHLAGAYALNKDFGKAIDITKRGIELYPEFSGFHDVFGLIYLGQSKFIEAQEEFSQISNPWYRNKQLLLSKLLQGKTGQLEGFIKKITENGSIYEYPFQVAELYGAAGDRAKCFEWLERAYEQKDPHILLLKIWPHVTKYKDEPKFKELIKKIGLE